MLLVRLPVRLCVNKNTLICVNFIGESKEERKREREKQSRDELML